MAFFLSVRTPGAGAPAPLRLDGRDVVIGRAADVDWSVPDPRVSSRHLMVGFRDGAYLVRDTSSNGTSVNGQPLTAIHRLQPGDVLAIGGTEILFDTAPAAAAAPAPVSAPMLPAGEALVEPLAAALATLLATRRRQLDELRAVAPDALARNPLASPEGAAGRLAALALPSARAAVAEATTAIERHHAASLAAMQAGLRAVLAELSPDALAATLGPATPAGDARDAALWRAFRERFNGDRLAGAGFVDRFAEAFRDNYARLAALA